MVSKHQNNKISSSGCIASALSIIGDKWTALIIKELVEGPKCYTEIESALNGISPRTLSARLDKLLDNQVIEKTLYCQHPPRHNYALTEKGKELEKILKTMVLWGNKYGSI